MNPLMFKAIWKVSRAASHGKEISQLLCTSDLLISVKCFPFLIWNCYSFWDFTPFSDFVPQLPAICHVSLEGWGEVPAINCHGRLWRSCSYSKRWDIQKLSTAAENNLKAINRVHTCQVLWVPCVYFSQFMWEALLSSYCLIWDFEWYVIWHVK